MFDGIPFSEQHPYSYREAKLLIRQAIPLLRSRKALQKFGIDFECKGRSAITGKDSVRVWDFISLKPPGLDGGFTTWPHLTLGIHDDMTEVMVTMPNSLTASCRKAFRMLGKDGFIDLCGEIAKNIQKSLGSDGYKPAMRIVHRHYPSQRSEAVVDGEMEVDLRAAFGHEKKGIKMQRHWFEAAYQLVTDRGSCNVQLQIGVNFPHSGGRMRNSDAPEIMEQAWLACKPLVNVLLEKKMS